jgi:CheY-like chemotaxis protein
MEAVLAPERSPHVLIVDDNRDYVDMMCEYLNLASDWVAEGVYGGEQALQRVRTLSPDVVLLDMEMPQMDGYETAEALRGAVHGPPPHLLCITANTELQQQASQDQRFAKALLKPMDPAELIRLLNRYR